MALLRGINVGGKSKVEMPQLKKLFESLGVTDVVTYINSGNVIFKDRRSPSGIKDLLEKALSKEFGFDLRVVLRTGENIKQIVKQVPSGWMNDKQQKTDVLFLWDEINNKAILKKVDINPKIENVLYIDGALVWNIGRENVLKGGGIKLVKSDLYKHITARNINTVRKLNQLMAV